MADATVPPRLRVGLVVPSLQVGGSERHVVKLCRHAESIGVAPTLFLLRRDLDAPLRAELPPGVPVQVNPYHRRDPRTVLWLASAIRESGVQVVQSFLWYGDAVASLARMIGPRVPLICSERGDRSDYSLLRRVLDRLVVFRLAKRLCTNSEYGRRMITALGYDARKVVVIPNGVDLARIDAAPVVDLRGLAGWPSSARVIGMVSRLVGYKGPDVLVEAAARLPEHVCCVLVGDGPERPALEELVRMRGLEARVKFLGTRSPSEPYLKGFEIAVLTTRVHSEHCSNSVLEAMASGRPVVATAVAGNPELIQSGTSGVLVPPEDPAALAHAIAALLEDPAAMASIGCGGRARVEQNYRMEEIAARCGALWRETAQRTQNGGV